jgi:hypothetical protein
VTGESSSTEVDDWLPGSRISLIWSRATNTPTLDAPTLPVSFAPKLGSTIVLVKTACIGLRNRSALSRKNDRFSG